MRKKEELSVNGGSEQPKGFQVWKNKKNGFTVALLHYSADPLKNESWVNSIKSNMAVDQWNQEYEIDWGVYTGKRFFQSFRAIDHIRVLKVIDGKAVLRGWDFGFHYPAVVFCQIDDEDRLMIIDEFHQPDIELEFFTQEVIEFSKKRYPNHEFKDYCDPAGTQRSDKGPRTSIEILHKHGVYPLYRRVQDENYAWGLVRQQLLPRPSGGMGLLVDPRCRMVIEGFESRMRYRNFREGQNIKEEAFEEHPYIDLFDALKYLVMGNFDYRHPQPEIRRYASKSGYDIRQSRDFMAM